MAEVLPAILPCLSPAELNWPQTAPEFAVLAAGYLLTLLLSGPLVNFFTATNPPSPPPQADPAAPKPRFSAGFVIGKCENVLTVTLVLLGEVTGLAMLFAAKSLVRKEDIRKNSQYYLGGTLVNLTWGVVMGAAMKYALTVV